MKYKEITYKIFNKNDNNIGKSLNFIQDKMEELRKTDKKDVENFFIRLNLDYEKYCGQDFIIINDKIFDYKEFENPQMIDELVDFAINMLKNEESKEKLLKLLSE